MLVGGIVYYKLYVIQGYTLTSTNHAKKAVENYGV